MKKVFFYILTVLFSSIALGQVPKNSCDEWNEISSKEINFEILVKKSKQYLSKVKDSCKTTIYLKLADVFVSQEVADSAFYYFDKAIDLSQKINHKESLANAYSTKAYVLAANNKKPEALKILKEARKILENTPKSINWIYYYQTSAYLADSDFDYEKAIKYTDSSISFAKKYMYDNEIDLCYLNRATYSLRVSDYKGAVESTLNAVDVIEKRDQKKNLEFAYYLLGTNYSRLRQQELAVTYLQKAIDRSEEVDNLYVKLASYSKLAHANFKLNKFNENITITDSIIAISKRLNNNVKLATGYNSKAKIYIHKKDYDTAESFLIAAQEIMSNNGGSQKELEFEKISNLDAFIDVYGKKKQYELMLENINKYKEIIAPLDLLIYKKGLQGHYASYYEKTNNTKKAFYHYKQWIKLKDSIIKKETQIEMADLEKQYDTKNKELEIVTLGKEKQEEKLKTQEARSRQFILFLIAIIAVALLLIGLWVFLKLKKQKQKIDDANHSLSKLNKVKDHLFSILAHDLRSMILPFQRVGKIMKYHIDKENYTKAVELSAELERNSQNLSNVLDNLLNWSLEQMNNYKVKLTNISVANELQEITESFKQHASYKNTNITVDCDTTDIVFDKGAFHLIFRNLIGNALKYTENGDVKISVIHQDNNVSITVEDTGIGIDPKKADKIFTLEKEGSTSGTKGEKGTGLGLNLVHRFVKLHNGKINISTQKPIGTAFHLFFPNCAINNG